MSRTTPTLQPTSESGTTAVAVARPAATAIDLVKTYGHDDTTVHALDGVSVAFAAGEFTAIMGPSGSGKSTLMHLLAALDTPTSGTVTIGDTDITGLDDKQLTLLRRDRIGFIFQAFNLLPMLTAAENIELPQRLAGRRADADWMADIVATVGLADRLAHRPAELSGGQQQRVAVARALAGRPEIVFADEPTGNLDSRSGAEVLSFMRSSVDAFGQTIVMVTHDAHAAAYADRVIFLSDGHLRTELRAPTPESVLDALLRLDTPALDAAAMEI